MNDVRTKLYPFFEQKNLLAALYSIKKENLLV